MAIISIDLSILCASLLIEASLGYPDALFRAISHPVVWIGWLIEALDRALNRGRHRKLRGVAALLALIVCVVGPVCVAQTFARALLPPIVAIGMLATLAATLLAQRSLWTHVAAVADAIERHGLSAGRMAVSKIVGRDPSSLDEAAVIRAAIESLAENFSDGVVAPALWCGTFGLPGIVFYKTVNTADSMIGHRTPRHAAFGWASARLDDLINLPASRLAVLWIVLAALLHGADAGAAIGAVWRDAGRHRSPNAGWPEAAMAGALGLRLAGPRVYGGVTVEDGWMGRGRADATPADLRRALTLYRTACMLQIAIAFGLLAIIAPGQ